jgi:hypothetical protein
MDGEESTPVIQNTLIEFPWQTSFATSYETDIKL